MSSAPYHPLASFSSRDSAPVNPPQPLVRELYGVGRGPGSGSARALSSGPGSESASAQQPVGLATQGAHLAGGSPGLATRGIAGSAKTGSGTVSVADNGGDDVERWREAVQGLRDAEILVGALEQLLLGPDTLFLDANAMRSARSVYDGQRQLHALNRRVAGLQGELDAAVEAAREARAGRRESEEERRRMQDALAQAQRDMEATSGVFDLYTSELRGRQQQLERAEEEVRHLQARLRAAPAHPSTSAHSSPQSASHSSASATSSISYSSAYGSVHSSAYASAASSVYGSAIDVPSPAPALATGAARAARAGAVSAWVAGAAASAGVASAGASGSGSNSGGGTITGNHNASAETTTITSTTDHSVPVSSSPLAVPSQPHASVQTLLAESGQQVAGEEEKTGGAVEALGGRQEEHGRELGNGREEEGQEMGTVGVSGGNGSERVGSQEEGTGTSNTEGDDDEFLDSLQ